MVGAGPEQHNTKRPKFSCHFWAAGSKSSILRVPSTPNRTKGLEDHLHHPSSPTHQPFLPLIPFKGLALPNQGLASKGTCYLFSLPAAASRRILLEILGWSLISFYWLKSPRTQLGNVLALPTTLLSCPVAPAQRSLGCSPKHPPPGLHGFQCSHLILHHTHFSWQKRRKQEVLVRLTSPPDPTPKWTLLREFCSFCKQNSAWVLSCLSCVQLFATLWTIDHQAPLSIGILQARILECIAISFSKGSSQPRDQTCVCCGSCVAGRLHSSAHPFQRGKGVKTRRVCYKSKSLKNHCLEPN